MNVSNKTGRPRKYHLDTLQPGELRKFTCKPGQTPTALRDVLLASAKNAFGGPGYITTRIVERGGAVFVAVKLSDEGKIRIPRELRRMPGRPSKYKLDKLRVGSSAFFPCDGRSIESLRWSVLRSSKTRFGRSGHVRTRAVSLRGEIGIKVTRIK